MNQKKQGTSQRTLLISVIAVVIVGAIGIGYLIGKKSAPAANTTSPIPSDSPATPSNVAAANPTPPIPPQKKGLTPAALAKAKNVPETLPDPAGDYQIVAVIDGEEDNRKLTTGLQVIGVQRQRLLSLSRQYDQTPAASIRQRELIAGEILKARNILGQNLQFMTQKYAYSLQFNYRLIPHAASLFLISKEENGTPTPELVHQFMDASSYELFQKMRDDYLLLSVKAPTNRASELSSEIRPAADEEPDPSPEATDQPPLEPEGQPDTDQAPENTAEPQFSPEMEALKAELIKAYNYDPTKNHQVNFTKTALYARPGVPQRP